LGRHADRFGRLFHAQPPKNLSSMT
jgi:hypothetical protein